MLSLSKHGPLALRPRERPARIAAALTRLAM